MKEPWAGSETVTNASRSGLLRFQNFDDSLFICLFLIPSRTISASQDTNKYLFYRASDNCFQCVALWSRHTNVLEYKAGECGETEDTEALCDISPDAALNTMVRVDGANIPCPIQVRSHSSCLR